MTNQGRITTFEDLEVYRVARGFRKAMYGVARQLPESEKFGLVSQIRRAAVSVTNNIAEGHGRFHYLDQIKFMLQARGSLEELIDDLNVCEDETYLPLAALAPVKQEGWRVRQLIDGYIRYLRGRKTTENSSSAREDPPIYHSGTEDELMHKNDSRFSDFSDHE